MRPITFRTQFTMNALTVLVVVLIAVTTNTFASPGIESLGQAANTTTISYQGRLTNTSGQPLNATVPMVFRLYAAPTGGTALWTESRSTANAVPVANGLFNVLLGSVTPISLNLLSRDLWLGISVNGDAEMTPREKLGTTPYAARSGIAQSVADRSVNTAKLVDQSVTNMKQTLTTYSALDTTAKRLQGSSVLVLSEFHFDNVPAGDVVVMATLQSQIYHNKNNNGSIWLDIAGTSSVATPLHLVESDRDSQLALHARLANFTGGVLIVKVMAGGENGDVDINFGAEGDGRFGRQVTVLAGF
jgi:hypothetical protein